MPERVRRATRIARVAFVVYALALLVATHWPRLEVQGPVPRSDLWVHMVAFALWGALLHATGWLGKAGTMPATLRALVVTLVYATLDEASQAIPLFGRVFDVSDLVANAGGALIGSAGAGLAYAKGARHEQ
jgi:VanZ family protein